MYNLVFGMIKYIKQIQISNVPCFAETSQNNESYPDFGITKSISCADQFNLFVQDTIISKVNYSIQSWLNRIDTELHFQQGMGQRGVHSILKIVNI